MWFAKTAFGPSYNVVQVKLHPEPIKSEYPEEYAFVEEEEPEGERPPSPPITRPECAPFSCAAPEAKKEICRIHVCANRASLSTA